MAEWRWFTSEGHGFPRTAKDKTCLGIKCKLRRREGVGNSLGGGMSPRVGPSIHHLLHHHLAATVCWGKQMTGQHQDLGHGFHPRYRPRYGLTKDLEVAEHRHMSNEGSFASSGVQGEKKELT